MPFKALDSKNNPVCTFDFSSKLELIDKYPDGFTCPYCRQKMYSRKPTNRILHFYHSAKCTSSIEHHPESMEHLLSKQSLYYEICSEIQKANNTRLKVEIEYPVKEAGEYGRIADLMITYDNQPYMAVECQLASITPELLKKRTHDYAEQGIDVIWFIGKNADHPNNREYLYGEFGDCHIIRFQEQLVKSSENIFGEIINNDTRNT